MASRAPDLVAALRSTSVRYALLDETLVEGDQDGSGQASYSRKPLQHGVNLAGRDWS
ncbi:hypothetical protein ACFXPJ_05985 [Streptomyces goshikiensis]